MAAERKEYEFTLVLSGVQEPSGELEDILFEAGCDDGVLFFRDSFGYISFVREGKTLEDAVVSAIKNVESVPFEGGLKVASVEPGDFVTGAEIARRLGRSKESVRLLISGERGKGGFPVPVAGLTSNTRIWRWSDVVHWFYGDQEEEVREIVKDAYTLREINESLAFRESPPFYRSRSKNKS